MADEPRRPCFEGCGELANRVKSGSGRWRCLFWSHRERDRLVTLVARWGAAVGVSVAGFVLAWWVCQELVRADEGISLGIAAAVLAVLLAVAGWWAARDADGGNAEAARRFTQKARAGRDVNMAGRDQTIINQRPRDE